ncbi:hypothetical protein [Streptomyces sp. NPDC046261]|uniref:hypothetical protein n=1 Tax=Streptomyces sp. NPDC046261 TaxID=3157200 RepID=UPI0033C73EE1
MPQRRRPTAAAVLLLLLAVVFAPALSGARPSASAPAGTSAFTAFAAVAAFSPDHATGPDAALVSTSRPEARPRADATDTGGACRQQDVPLKGAEIAVAPGHGDPLTGPGATRVALPQSEVPRAGAGRAPPAPVAGCAELLPVLRI